MSGLIEIYRNFLVHLLGPAGLIIIPVVLITIPIVCLTGIWEMRLARRLGSYRAAEITAVPGTFCLAVGVGMVFLLSPILMVLVTIVAWFLLLYVGWRILAGKFNSNAQPRRQPNGDLKIDPPGTYEEPMSQQGHD